MSIFQDAIDQEYISKVPGEYSEVFIVHTMTKAHEAIDNCEDEECEVDHNHFASKSCSKMYECDNCCEKHDTASEAEDCCAGWECNFCGWTHKNGWYSHARYAAAECCYTSCEDCGESGWPTMFDYHECNSGMGMRRQLPWEARGVVVDARKPDEGENWKVAYNLDPEKHNVVQAAADYYLLEAMTAGVVGTTDGKGNIVLEKLDYTGQGLSVKNSSVFKLITNEAQEMMDALVKKWDPILINYVHMAVGGELRHHTAVGGAVMSTNRDKAWSGWKYIFEAVGPDALVDAAELFREFTGGSYGGNPWAEAAEILHARLTHKIKPQMFLDRVFNAEHNGGCLMNKVSWGGDRDYCTQQAHDGGPIMQLAELSSYVLPAHGVEPEPNYPVLLAYASPEVRELFDDCFKFAAHAAVEMGISLSGRAPKPKAGEREYERRERAIKQQEKIYALQAIMPKYEKYLTQWEDYGKSQQVYAAEMEKEAKRNAKKLVDQQSCEACMKHWYCDEHYISWYYKEMVEMYENNQVYYADKIVYSLASKGLLGLGYVDSEPMYLANDDSLLAKIWEGAYVKLSM